MEPPDPLLERVSAALATVPGVIAVALGGSRATGAAHASSDTDIGLYFSECFGLDVERLRNVVRSLVDEPAAAQVTDVGGWGPWIVGGGWLTIGAMKVDLLYRPIESVERVIGDSLEGRVSMDYQPGHPHGFCSAIWMGKVALCQPLSDPEDLKRVIERLYACSHLLNEAGQYAYYGRVRGCLITGNEDGIKHCAMNVLYSLQHLGYTIPPQADAGWIGEAGPGPSYLDPGSGGPENDFTNRNTTFMTWNLLHLARMLKDAGGIPAHGNQRSEWDAGCRFDFHNPEHR